MVFLLVTLIAIYGVLKFLGCLRPCYNCKKCTFGLGRLATLYFGKRSLKDYKYNYKLPTAIFFYTLIGPLPAAILPISTIQTFAILKIAVLLALIIFSIYSALTWRTNNKTQNQTKNLLNQVFSLKNDSNFEFSVFLRTSAQVLGSSALNSSPKVKSSL